MAPCCDGELHYSVLLNVFVCFFSCFLWKGFDPWSQTCRCLCVCFGQHLSSLWVAVCVFSRRWKARPPQPEHDGGCWIGELSGSGQSEAAGGQYSPRHQSPRAQYWMEYLAFQAQFFVFETCRTVYFFRTLKCCVLQESPHTKERLEKDKGESKGKIRRPK